MQKWHLLKLLQESGQEEDEAECWEGEFMYDIFDTL
jgi:hypothetical protein